MAIVPIPQGGMQAGGLAAQLAQQQTPGAQYTDQAAIDRKRRLAEMLAQNAQRPVDSGLGAASAIAQALAARFKDKKADKLDAQNADYRNNTLAMVLAQQDPAMQAMMLARAQDPNLQEFGLNRTFGLQDEGRASEAEQAKYAREVADRRADAEAQRAFQAQQAQAGRSFDATQTTAAQRFAAEQNALNREVELGKAQAAADAKAAAEAAELAAKAAEESKAKSAVYNTWEVARNGVTKALNETGTGLRGRLPALTADQQTAEGAISALAPVLKQLFRVSGEGVFTDRDQQLLLDMVPKRSDTSQAIAAKIQNVDAIVRAKLGIAEPPAGAQASSGAPQPGQVEDGYRFKGGNPADPNAWEKL